MKIHCPQLKHFLSKAVLQRIQEWSDKMPDPKFVFFLKLWVVNENKEKEINGGQNYGRANNIYSRVQEQNSD